MLLLALFTLSTLITAHDCRADSSKDRIPRAVMLGLGGLEAVQKLSTPGVGDLVREQKTSGLDYAGSSSGQAKPTGEPLRFALPQKVNVNPGAPQGVDKSGTYSSLPADGIPAESMGTWQSLGGGEYIWRLRASSPDAVSLNFGFTSFHMPEGGALYVYSPDGTESYGPYTARDNEVHGQLWTPPIKGSEAVIEVSLPEDRIPELVLKLDSVNRGFLDTEGSGKSGSCNVDVICSPQGDATRDQIRSVARILISGAYWCSGALIGSADEGNVPYFLTAEHCGVTESTAASVVFTWNYEQTYCRTGANATDPDNGSTADTQTGAIFRASHDPSDMTLIELDDPIDPSYNVFFAGWDNTGNAPSEGTTIHHPSGDNKRISYDGDALTTTSYGGSSSPGDGTHLRVSDWDWGTTEGGSSGAPLFDSNKRIVGQLHGGSAACGNDEPDWYGKLSTSWDGGGTSSTRLKDWLDPNNSGATTLDGRDVPGCTFALGDYEIAVINATYSVNLYASAGSCDWTATTSDSWITVDTPSGTGDGTVEFTIADTNSSRSGTIIIGNRTLDVTQSVSVIPASTPAGNVALSLMLLAAGLILLGRFRNRRAAP